MRGGQPVGADRGVSEILGTVLVFAFVILIATVLLGLGFQLFDGATEEFDDRLGQDTMAEIDDRLGAAEGGTTLEIPHGVGDQLNAFPTEGNVTVTVTTDDDGGNLTGSDLASGSLSAEEKFTVGTLAHETSDGVQTVYQGGLLFEDHGEEVLLLSEPAFDFDGEQIDFSLVDVSTVSHLGDGDEVFAERDGDASEVRSAEIEQLVHEQRTIGSDVEDPAAFASVNITVTVETDHPEAWERYGEERMTASPVVQTGEDYVEFRFGEFAGDELEEVDFGDRVLYSGVADLAHVYYNDTLGEISETEDGFNITDTGQTGAAQIHQDVYGLAVVDEQDSEEIWKIYDAPDSSVTETESDWVDVSNASVDEPDTFNRSESAVAEQGVSEDEWVWDGNPTVCLVVPEEGGVGNITTEDVKEIIADGNCAQTAVGDSDPPEPEPVPEIESFEPQEAEVEVSDDAVFDVTVNNTGTGFANESLVGLEAVLGEDGADVVDFDRLSLYPHEGSETLELSFPATPAFDADEGVTAFTVDDSNETSIDVVDHPFFEITELEALEEGASPGEPFELNATVENNGTEAEQIVSLTDDDGDVVDTAPVELEMDEEDDVTLTWDVPLGADLDGGTELTVETRDDDETITVEQAPAALVDDVEVLADTIDPDDETVDVEVTLENPSAEELTDADVWLGEESDLLDTGTTEMVTIDGESTTTVTVDAELADDPITDWIVVETDDDRGEAVGVVERDGPDCSEVDYDESDGTYEISDVDQLQCIEENGLDEEYVVVDDIAAHGTEYWNGGDGFEPIGEGGHHYAPQDPSRCDVPCDWDGQLFNGTFDGGGNVIEGLTIERPNERFVGLFGSTSYPHLEDEDGEETIPVGFGSTIENVRLADVYVHGKQHVGALAGQAGGEVIQSRSEGTVIAEQQLVGGLIGDAAHGDVDNELVAEGTVVGGDNPDGTLGEGIGGLIGRTHWGSVLSTAYTQNIDVEYTGSDPPPEDEYPNTGGVLGASSYVDSEFEQMYTNVSVPTDDGGAIVGTILQQSGEEGDFFADSVYWDETEQAEGYGGQYGFGSTDPTPELEWNERVRAEMLGPGVLPSGESESFYNQFPGVTEADAQSTMENLDWDVWTPVYEIDEDGEIINEDLPIFQWEVAGQFLVTIESVDDPIVPGEDHLEVGATVENTGDEEETQTILLQHPDEDDSSVVATETVTLDAGDETSVTLTWETAPQDRLDEDTTGEVIVRSDDTADTESVELEASVESALLIDSVEAEEEVEALNEELAVDVTLAAADGALEDATEDEQIALRANGNLVDVVPAEDVEDGENLTWRPALGDVGTAELEVQVLGTAESETETTTVRSPAEPFTPGDVPPIDADLDLIDAD